MSGLKPLLAVYLSGHGYGHCTRTSAFLERLLARIDCDLDVTTSCPRALWPRELDAHTRSWRALACDAGIVQSHDLAVDRTATAEALEQWERSYEQRLDQETSRIKGRAGAVLADVPPLALAVARLAGIPGFALANFSWDWIYAHMGFEAAATHAAEAYSSAEALFELEPAAPMYAFARKLALGVLGRGAKAARADVRRRLGLAAHERLVLVALRDPTPYELPPPSIGVRYALAGARVYARRDVILAADIEFVDLVGAADVVVAKAGYGIIADTATCGTPLMYALRGGFPEDAVLARWLERRPATLRVDADALYTGRWLAELDELLRVERPPVASAPGAAHAIELLAAALSA